jgi:hypothetical protein
VRGRGPGWCTDRVTLPLVFRHGAAETVFTIAVLVWLVFEAVMRAMAAEIRREHPDSPADLGAVK